MCREEYFDDGFEGVAIFRPAEAVAFIAIADTGHGDAVRSTAATILALTRTSFEP